ncbi:outer membrane protein [Rhodoplanes sp. Z2-YC6860]|uniref:outer membrane protein n=1 Tax=Rhodoplanes sp. Z2-YC6860 TaxID=674703 RepID=UPI00078C6C02|nr:outer membrane beta-barrel protein [Rhodoplanes sp. Z2-YC6860]AMN43362.1 carbohydrate-selective porin [Rhodoplanes sp. Z2-YC6860]
MADIRIAAGSVALSVLFAGLASAADMPVKAVPKAPVPVPAWEGFYVGGHVGYGFGVSRFDRDQTGAAANGFSTDFLSNHGIAGGALAGYNHLLTSRVLIGLEGDVGWSDITFRTDVPDIFIPNGGTTKFDIKMSYAARARLGFLLTPETLLFATGGWVRSKYEYLFDVPNLAISESGSRWLDGWQVGAGMETSLYGNWGARLEYLHSFYKADTLITQAMGPVQTKESVGVGRVALIYRFGQPPGSQANSWAGSWDSAGPAPSWTGFYGGAAVGPGAGSTKVDSVDIPGLSFNGFGLAGVIPAGLFGYNLRVAERVVAGVESEIAPGVSTTEFKLEPIVAVRGRLGYLVTPANLAYVSAGWVSTGIKTQTIINNIVTIPSQRVNGFQVGGGIESAITDHWLARFAYQYSAARALDNIVADFKGTPATFQAYTRWHYGEVALVYLFGAP